MIKLDIDLFRHDLPFDGTEHERQRAQVENTKQYVDSFRNEIAELTGVKEKQIKLISDYDIGCHRSLNESAIEMIDMCYRLSNDVVHPIRSKIEIETLVNYSNLPPDRWVSESTPELQACSLVNERVFKSMSQRSVSLCGQMLEHIVSKLLRHAGIFANRNDKQTKDKRLPDLKIKEAQIDGQFYETPSPIYASVKSVGRDKNSDAVYPIQIYNRGEIQEAALKVMISNGATLIVIDDKTRQKVKSKKIIKSNRFPVYNLDSGVLAILDRIKLFEKITNN